MKEFIEKSKTFRARVPESIFNQIEARAIEHNRKPSGESVEIIEYFLSEKPVLSLRALKEPSNHQLMIRMPIAVFDAIEEIADEEDRSMNNVITRILRYVLGE